MIVRFVAYYDDVAWGTGETDRQTDGRTGRGSHEPLMMMAGYSRPSDDTKCMRHRTCNDRTRYYSSECKPSGDTLSLSLGLIR